jgi:nucleoside-diphosphate-sugar epimerase
MRLFRDRTDQFVFISSASAYMKPLGQWLIREDTPLANPYWDYSRGKIAAEERCLRALREEGFPITIVRPSHTYGDWSMPLAVSSWSRSRSARSRGGGRARRSSSPATARRSGR